MNEKKVSWILKYGTYTLIIIGIFDALFFSGFFVPTVIGSIVAVGCANKCVMWASEINRNLNLAFLIGIILGLIGLLTYWIFYKRNLKHQQEAENL